MQIENVMIPACDGYELAGTVYQPEQNETNTVVTINAATAVPQQFYKAFATFLAEQGYTVITFDYRGIGGSKPESLRGFKAKVEDWAMLDMAGVVDWVQATYQPKRLFFVGHSYGGQTAGMLPNADQIDAMVTFSSQSGYWKLQGGNQKLAVLFHMYVTFPLMSHLFGYMPWSKLGSAEDMPKGVALGWARWCRHPEYLMGDKHLPLERYQQFKAPVLAYSFADDNWGTKKSVDTMMSVYPNITRRHVLPSDIGLEAIGHVGFFRPKSAALWPDIVAWLEEMVSLE
ncbi:MAG: alpha/beta fold hydrolase [Chloroflexi bacterium]|nr:alpha/beta fold hydrolase [Chloroflexota bacterium]